MSFVQVKHRIDARISVTETTLILIDLQERLMPAIEDGAAVVDRCLLLARGARALGIPILGTEENPTGLGATASTLVPLINRVIAKRSFDACREDVFLQAIPQTRRNLVVAGCEAHVRVLQTVLGLRRQGFEISVVADAVGSRRRIDRATALARLEQNGIEIVTTEMALFEWLGHCDHPKFKELLALIR